MVALVRNLNALLIFIYCSIIGMALYIQFAEGETPCPLCYLQRIGMLGVAISAFLNLVYGVRLYHYGLALLSSVVGGSVAVRQILLHVCPDFPKFGVPFWGLSLYTWSFLTFVAVVLYVSLLLILYRPEQSVRPERWNAFQRLSCTLLVILTATNILAVLRQCGLGLCE